MTEQTTKQEKTQETTQKRRETAKQEKSENTGDNAHTGIWLMILGLVRQEYSPEDKERKM